MKIEMDKIKTVEDVCVQLKREIDSVEIEMKQGREDIKSLKLENLLTECTTNELKKAVGDIKNTVKYMIINEVTQNKEMMARMQSELDEEYNSLQESKKAIEDYIGESITDIIPGIEISLQELNERQVQLEEKQRELELGHFTVHNQVENVTNVAARVSDEEDMTEDVKKMNMNPIYRFESGRSLLKILIQSQNTTYNMQNHYTIIKIMTSIIEDCEKKIKEPAHHKTKDMYHWIIKDLKKMRKYLDVTKGKKEHAIENGCAKVFIDHLNKFAQDYHKTKKNIGDGSIVSITCYWII